MRPTTWTPRLLPLVQLDKMITFVSLSLALAASTVMASPLPQVDSSALESSTESPTVVIDPMPTAPVCEEFYTSVDGDTCASIGAKYGLTANQIHEANTFLNCDDIWTWTPICIPGGGVTPTSTSPPPSGTCASTYTSVSGDTCATIGAKYGLTAGQIHEANSFLNCDDIWVWTPVCIPQTSTPPQPTCATTYTSQAGDTCETIEAMFGLPAGSVKAANDFVTCNDIWQYTPICIPPVATFTATLPTLSVPAPTETATETETLTPTSVSTYDADPTII